MAWSQNRIITIVFISTLFSAIFIAPVTEARADTVATPGRVGVGSAAMKTDVWISAEADRLSGRKLNLVCAASAQEWAERLTEVGFRGAAGEYYGFSLVHRDEMHLSPYVCEGLRFGTSAPVRRSHEFQVAWSVNVLIHESVHLARRSADEKLAEACARTALPGALHRLYRVEYNSAQMRRMISASAWFRRTMPPAYRGGTCSAPGAWNSA